MNLGYVVTVMAALGGGGLAGAVFQWYVTRPEPTVATYDVATTAVLADRTLKTVVPDIKILVAGEEIPALYTHTVQVAVARGRDVDSADLAITFSQDSNIGFPFFRDDSEPKKLRIFGVSAEAPSAVHKIDCTQLPNGARCTIKSLSLKTDGHFAVTIATNRRSEPEIVMNGKDVELVSAQRFLDLESKSSWAVFTGLAAYSWALVGLIIGVVFSRLQRRIERFRSKKPSA